VPDPFEEADVVALGVVVDVDVAAGVDVDETEVTIGRLYAMLKSRCRTMRQELEFFCHREALSRRSLRAKRGRPCPQTSWIAALRSQ